MVQSLGDAGVYPVDAHTIYDNLAAKDKTLEFIPGDHYLQEPSGARAQITDPDRELAGNSHLVAVSGRRVGARELGGRY